MRDLKTKKAVKPEVEAAVKILLALKADYKQATGQDWKPDAVVAQVPAASSSSASSIINDKIVQQGNLVRDLKAAKAAKPEVEAAVKGLLALKADYKTETGQDWKPSTVPVAAAPAPISAPSSANSTNDKIVQQGNLVRDLKAAKATKPEIDAAVKGLLGLKADYKKETGQDWKPGTVPVAVAPAAVSSGGDSTNGKIITQGNLVRDLKAAKAGKAEIETAVKGLLALKADYKKETGQDWKPSSVPAAVASAIVAAPVAASLTGNSTINDKIVQQGNLVRDLKAAKAAKAEIDTAVKELLALKADYKKDTGNDWKPGTVSAAPATAPATATPVITGNSINEKIIQQGNLVRDLKTQKASKSDIDNAVKSLLALKADYKKVTGQDWKPTPAVTASPSPVSDSKTEPIMNSDSAKLDAAIVLFGNSVRDLKSQKAPKVDIDAAVKNLLALKAEYKIATGTDWKPNVSGVASVATTVLVSVQTSSEDVKLAASIAQQGDKVRDLKAAKAEKSILDDAVKTLLALKADFKKLTGADWKPVGGAVSAARTPSKPKAPVQSKPAPKVAATGDDSGPKKQTRLGMEALKGENLAEWYSQVLTKSELIEYYDVSGCYILRPWAMSIWRFIHTYLHEEITRLGVKEVYFPMFVSKAALQKEKDHIADFSPEVAWVTKSGDSDLAEPIAIRPTSETIMYPAFAKWIQSYRDLPLRLNQWSNIVRWEFKHPQPFLRTREFLWQEGHSAFADVKEAEKEVLDMLGMLCVY